MGAGEARQLISPIIEEIFLWCYMRVVEQCREQGITPVWVCIPAEPGEDDPEKVAKIERLARKAGFITLDLTDVYDGHVGSDLRLSMWDKHPNPKGHRLLADRLHRALQENKDRIPMGLSNSYIANPTSRESN